MEFLSNLFWFPFYSSILIFNLALWALIGYGIYEAIRKFKEQQQGVNNLGQGQGIDLIQRAHFYILLLQYRQRSHPARFEFMNKRQRKAMKESVITVFSGMLINWPVSIVLLYLFIDVMEMDILETSIYMTLGFTVVALIRVYIIRLIFEI